MTRESTAQGEMELFQALMRRGFVNLPRILFDYAEHLGLDYDTIGKLAAILHYVSVQSDGLSSQYTLTRASLPRDFEQVRTLLTELVEKDWVMVESAEEPLIFSFTPLYSRLRAAHEQSDQHQQGIADRDPAIMAAEQLLVNLSDQQVSDIQDWVSSYGFSPELVQAVIREGQNQGVTRRHYLNQIALQWHEEGVKSLEDAELFMQRYRRTAGKHKSIMQYLGLNRKLTAAEQALLNKWTEDWGFSNEVVIAACTEAIGKQYPLQYINRVLETWRERGVRTVADVEQVLVEHKRRTVPDAARETATATRRQPPKSNVFLQRGKKGEKSYDHIYKRFDD